MAVLYIAEFANLTPTPNGVAAIAAQPPLAEQVLAVGSVVSSVAFQPATSVVRLHTDAICSIAFGATPVATTTKTRMAANQTEYFGVPRGAGWSVSVVSNS